MRQRFQRLLLPAVQLGMQVCWLYAWLSLIETRVLDHSVISPVVILFALLGTLTRGYLETLPVRRIMRIACHWILWVVLAALAGKLLLYPAIAWGQAEWVFALPRSFFRLIFETQPAQLLLLLGSGCAWYLGGRAASHTPGHGSLLGQFQFGLVMLLAAFLVAHGLGVSLDNPALLSLAFFALSLTGIAVTRTRQGGSERSSSPAGRQFAGSLLSLLVVVGLLGLLAGVAITPDLVGVFIDAGRAVLHALEAALLFLFSLLPTPDMPSGGEVAPATGDDSALTEFYRALPWPALLRRIMFILWVIVVMGMLLFALWRVCSMVLEWLKRRSNMAGVEVESLDTGLLADILALLLWLDSRARNLVQRMSQFVRRRLGATGEPTWSSVYAGFVRWAGKKLRPRQSSQSAHEYEVTLSELVPAAIPDLAFVTDIYARARYGGREPDSTTLQQMQCAVQRIRRAPRQRQKDNTNTQTEGAE